MNRKNITKAISAVLIGGMMLSGGSALAGEATDTADKNPGGKFGFIRNEMKGPGWMGKKQFGVDREKRHQALFDQLVKDGLITQEKADEIKAFAEKAAQERQKQHEEFKNLSLEERKAQMEKMKAEGPKERMGLFDDLVKNNILTQEQADTIKAKLKENMAKQFDQKKLNGITNDQK